MPPQHLKVFPWTVYRTLRRAIDGEYDGASEAEKQCVLEHMVRTSSSAASVIALEPIPFVDSAIIAPIHRGLIRGTGRIRTRHVDDGAAQHILKALRPRFVAQHLTLAGSKFVPFFAGDLVAFSVAYAGTATLGDLADRYFASGHAMTADDIRKEFDVLYKRTFEVVYRQRRDEIKSLFRKTPDMRRQLDELNRDVKGGRVDMSEAHRRTEQILNPQESPFEKPPRP
ncbi:MAG: hypothetical protein ABSC94_03950 [Polyangiaceae bacterium]